MSNKHGQCKHFNGAQNELCDRGVSYEQFRPGMPCIQWIARSERGGTYLRPGEEPAEKKPFPGAQPPERCPFYEEPTDADVQAERAEREAYMQKFVKVMGVVSTWRTWSKTNRVAKAEIIACPACGGRLHLAQAANNGHVHGSCETEGCVRWMQ